MKAKKIMKLLNLSYLDSGESGFYSQISESAIKVLQNGQVFKANSSIYYMLTEEFPVNYLHRLEMDDMHIICKGGPLSYYVFYPDGTSKEYIIGKKIKKGEIFTLMIPANCWKALKLHKGVEYALMVSVLTPEWTKDRVVIGAGQEFIDKYANSSEWATPEFLKELIGPNLKNI